MSIQLTFFLCRWCEEKNNLNAFSILLIIIAWRFRRFSPFVSSVLEITGQTFGQNPMRRKKKNFFILQLSVSRRLKVDNFLSKTRCSILFFSFLFFSFFVLFLSLFLFLLRVTLINSYSKGKISFHFLFIKDLFAEMMFSNSSIDSPKTFAAITNEEAPCHSEWLYVLIKIQPVFLILFGFIANLCSFIVLIQPRLRRRPTFSYLAFLSLSNAFLSLIHAIFNILGVYFELTLENLPLFPFCRLLNRFLIDFLTHFSLYTLTAVDLDRVRTVTSKIDTRRRYSQSPSLARSSYPPAFRHVCLIELTFAGLLFVLNLHWLTSYGHIIIDDQVTPVRSMTMCAIPSDEYVSVFYKRYLTSILPLIELLLFGILPFLISLVATIIILRHVSVKYAFLSQQNHQFKQSRRRLELHLSILLISLNCVFLLFTTPHNVFTVYFTRYQRNFDRFKVNPTKLCTFATIQKSLDLLQQCYFMSTFFLYILTNKRFRTEFYTIHCCRLKKLSQSGDTRNNEQQNPSASPTPTNLHVVNGKKNLMIETHSMMAMSDASQFDDD